MNRKKLISNYASSIVSGIIISKVLMKEEDDKHVYDSIHSPFYYDAIEESFYLANRMFKEYKKVIKKEKKEKFINNIFVKLVKRFISFITSRNFRKYREKCFKLSIDNCIKNNDLETANALKKAM